MQAALINRKIRGVIPGESQEHELRAGVPPTVVSLLRRPNCTRIDPVKLNISRPSADAPDSMAIYERLRQISADDNADQSDEDILTEVVSALFNIVAKLESQSGGS
jgi:hypothetical protein